jgi:hypothetical protein
MFAKPTINDFLKWIDWHIGKAHKRAQASVEDVRHKAAAVGRLNSGYTVLQSLEVVRSAFDAGVEAVLGELQRVIRKTGLDREELRRLAGERLVDFATTAKTIAQIPEASGVSAGIDKQVAEWRVALDDHLDFALRQFDVGILEPAEPEMPPMARNYINISGTITGSTIAQASPGAKQSVEFNLNVETVNKALAAFETAVTSASLPPDTLAELTADIGTIRAQLAKSRPNQGIIQEAGKSLRNVVEGIVGGMLTAPVTTAVTTAAAMLWSALGIG